VTAAAEFNFYCDPEAAYVTVHNMKCPITVFPWEAAYKYGRIPYVSNVYGRHPQALNAFLGISQSMTSSSNSPPLPLQISPRFYTVSI
jgi:inosine-uridine nucleoside N-ribohydrolase